MVLETKGDFKNIKDIKVVKVQGGVNVGPRASVKNTAYEKDPVGLAVDVFCVLLPLESERLNYEDLMANCINIVKQAKVAFE